MHRRRLLSNLFIILTFTCAGGIVGASLGKAIGSNESIVMFVAIMFVATMAMGIVDRRA